MRHALLATAAAITTLTAITALTTPATAATPTTKTTSPIALATTIAGRFWNATPCNGQIKILTRQPASALVEPNADAWVTFTSSLGPNNLAAPATTYTACTIHLGNYRWPTTTSMTQDWDMLCMTITHEYGHLLGHVHDTTPGSVMNPVFTNYTSEPTLCKTDRPAGALR